LKALRRVEAYLADARALESEANLGEEKDERVGHVSQRVGGGDDPPPERSDDGSDEGAEKAGADELLEVASPKGGSPGLYECVGACFVSGATNNNNKNQ
jgi:hypothetical protein